MFSIIMRVRFCLQDVTSQKDQEFISQILGGTFFKGSRVSVWDISSNSIEPGGMWIGVSGIGVVTSVSAKPPLILSVK